MFSMVESPDDWSTPSQGAVWPVVAVTLLLGIGLVSLLNAFTTGVGNLPPLIFPADVGTAPILLVTPGAENVLEALDRPERVTLQPPDQPIAELAPRFAIV